MYLVCSTCNIRPSFSSPRLVPQAQHWTVDENRCHSPSQDIHRPHLRRRISAQKRGRRHTQGQQLERRSAVEISKGGEVCCARSRWKGALMSPSNERAMGAVSMDQLTENDKIMQAISNATESPKMPTSGLQGRLFSNSFLPGFSSRDICSYFKVGH